MKNFITWMLIACLLPHLTGCADLADKPLTARLWSSDLASNHNGPMPNPNLQVSSAKDHKDYLVQYEEQRDRDAKIKRRAYWLYANQSRINAGKKPKFIDPPKVGELQAIPVETNAVVDVSITNAVPVRVVLLSDQRHFTIIANGAEVGSFVLPAYADSTSRAELIALTPVTVVTDAAIGVAIVAVAAGCIYLWACAQNGGTL